MKSISKPMAGIHSDHMEVIVVTVHDGKAVTTVKELFEGNFSVSTKSRQKSVFNYKKLWINCSNLKLI